MEITVVSDAKTERQLLIVLAELIGELTEDA